MENELNLLLFEVNNEIVEFGAETGVTVLYLKEDGQYLDHYVDGSINRTPPLAIIELAKDIKLYKTTLNEFYKAVLIELTKRNKCSL